MSTKGHFTSEFSDITLSGSPNPGVTVNYLGGDPSNMLTLRLGHHNEGPTQSGLSMAGVGTANQYYVPAIWVTDAAPYNDGYPWQLQSGANVFIHSIYGYEDAGNLNAIYSFRIGHLHYAPGAGDVHPDYEYDDLTNGFQDMEAADEPGTASASSALLGAGVAVGAFGSKLVNLLATHTINENDRIMVEWAARINTNKTSSIHWEFGGMGNMDTVPSGGITTSYGSEVVIPVNFGEKHDEAWGHGSEIVAPFGTSISWANISAIRTWLTADWGDAGRVVSRRGSNIATNITQQMWSKQDDDYLYLCVNNIIDGCIQPSDHAYLYFCGSNNWRSSLVPDFDDYQFSIDIVGKESQTDDPTSTPEWGESTGGTTEIGPRILRGAKGHPEADIFPFGWVEGIWHTGTGSHTPRGSEIPALDDNRVTITFSGIDQTLSGYQEAGVTFTPYSHFSSTASIVSNVISNDGPGKAGYALDGDLRQDVSISVDWTISGTTPGAAVALLARIPADIPNPPTYYEAEWSSYGDGSYSVIFEKEIVGVGEILASGTVSGIVTSEVVNVRFRCEDDEDGNPDLTLYFNGKTVLQVKDTVSGITSSGFVGLELYNTIGTLSNLRIGDPTNYKADFWEEGVDFRFSSETAGTSTAPDPNTDDVSTVAKSARTTFKIRKDKMKWNGRFAEGTWDGIVPLGFIMNAQCDIQGQGNTIFPASLGNQLSQPAWNYIGQSYSLDESKQAGGLQDSELDLRPLMAGHLHAPTTFIENVTSDGLSTTAALLTVTSGVAGEISLQALSNGLSTTIGVLTSDISLIGTSDGNATAAGILALDKNLIGISDGLSTITASLSQDINLVSTSDGTSTTAAILSQNKNLIGTSDGVSTVNAKLSNDINLVGTSDGISTTIGNLLCDVGFQTISNGTSTTSAILSQNRNLLSTSDGTSTATAILTKEVKLLGTTNGISTVNVILSLDKNILGISDGTSTVSAIISNELSLVGLSDGISTTVGNLLLDVNLQGTSDGFSTITAILSRDRGLQGTSDGLSAITGDIDISKSLLGTAAGVATTIAVLTPDRGLQGISDGLSTVTGALSNEIVLQGISNGVSTANAVLSTAGIQDLLGLSDGSATTAGILSLDKTLISTSDGTSTVNAILVLNKSIQSISAGISTANAIFSIDRNLEGTSDGLSTTAADLTLDRNLQGLADGLSTSNAILSLDKNFNETSNGNSTSNAILSIDKNLEGISNGLSISNAELTVEGLSALIGTADGIATVDANLSIDLIVAGTSTGTSTVDADINADLSLQGVADGLSTVTGDLTPDRNLIGTSDGNSTTDIQLVADISLKTITDGIATVNGDLTNVVADVTLIGTSDGVSTTTGALSCIRSLQVNSNGTSTVTGALTRLRNLTVISNGVSTATSALNVIRNLVNISDGVATVNASLSVEAATEIELVGASIGSSTSNANVSIDRTLAGISTGSSTIIGNFGDKELKSTLIGFATTSAKLTLRPGITDTLPELDVLSEEILNSRPQFGFVAPVGVGIELPPTPPLFRQLDPNEQRERLRVTAKALNILATAVQARADKRSNLTIKLDPLVDAEAIQAIRRKFPDADPTKISYDQYKASRDVIRKLGEENGRKPLRDRSGDVSEPNFGIGTEAARDGTLLRPELNSNARVIEPLNIFDYQDFVIRVIINFMWKYFIKPNLPLPPGVGLLLIPDQIVPLKPEGLADSILGLGGHILGMG